MRILAVVCKSSECVHLPFGCFHNSISSIVSSVVRSSDSVQIDIPSKLFEILSLPNWHNDDFLKNVSGFVSTSHVSSLLERNLNPNIALSFFSWIKTVPGFKHNVESYLSMLKLLIRSRKFIIAENILVSMINSCETNDDMQLVLAALRKLNNDRGCGFKPTVRCYNAILVRLARFHKVGDMISVYAELLSYRIQPNLYTLNTMVNVYCKIGDVVQAQLYVSIIFKSGLLPDAFTHSSLILGHCRNKNVIAACRVFEKMRQMGRLRDSDSGFYAGSYTILIHGFCESNRMDEALKLFFQMPMDGCFPTDRTFNVLITAFCESDRIVDALNLFKEMKDKSIEPTDRTFTVLIRALCESGRIVDALKLFKEMKDKSFEPNFPIYNVAIIHCCRQNNLDEARRLYSEMLEKGLVPSMVAFNALIDGHCKKGLIDPTFQILSFIVESKKCDPNIDSYNKLIHVYCVRKEMHKAMLLLNKILEHKLSPNLCTYSSLSFGNCRIGDIDSAYRLLGLMKEKGLVPPQWVYGSFIDALCKKGRVEEAQSLFDRVKDNKGDDIKGIYCSLIDGYCKSGRMDEANSLFEKMTIDDKVLPNSWTFNILIDGLCKEKKVQEALIFLQKMEKMDVKPTQFTYSSLIHGLLSEGAMSDAHKLLDQMVSSGCKPDACVYSQFINAFFSQGDLEQVELLRAKMNEEGVIPDMVTYRTLIKGYAALGLTDPAFEVLRYVIDSGCKPFSDIYSILLKLISSNSERDANISDDLLDVWKVVEFETVLKLFEKMEKHGCSPNSYTFGTLIAGFCKEGRLDESHRLVHFMKERGFSPGEYIYNSIFTCCCKIGVYEEAMTVAKTLIDSGHLPHIESYKAMLCGFYDDGKPDKARDVFRTVLSCGYNCDEIVWKILIDGLLKEKGLVQRCLELKELMETMDFRPTSFTHTLLMKELTDRGNEP